MDEPTPPSRKGDGTVEGPPPRRGSEPTPNRAVEEIAESLFAAIGEGWITDPGRSRGSQRRRIALSIASVIAGLLLIGLLGQGGGWIAESGEIVLSVAIVVVLLIFGVVYGLRPWSDS